MTANTVLVCSMTESKVMAARRDRRPTGFSASTACAKLEAAHGETRIDSASLAEVCWRYGVKEMSLFGSAARGEMRPDSDIGIVVEFEPGERVGLIKFENLARELEVLAGRRVDLVTKRGLKPWVRPEVVKDARVIYAV
jgi:hypothetical protein